jgi:hypothetical protein
VSDGRKNKKKWVHDPTHAVSHILGMAKTASIADKAGAYYSKSFEFGLRPGSFERNPKTKSEMKKITTV